METKNTTEINLKIPMLPNMELIAANTAEFIANYFSFKKEAIEEVKSAVIESTINAIEHSDSKEKIVEITYMLENDNLIIKIHDKGTGYNPEDLDEPNIKEKFNNSDKRGWGMSLINEMMDEVDVVQNNDGCEVIMKKRRL